MKVLLVLAACLAAHGSASAQDDDTEYRMEIGGGLGLTAYQGDLNGSVLKGMQPTIGATAKYKLNPRMAWTMTLATGKVKGSATDVSTWYPELHALPVDFNTTLTDLSLRFEYNFWAFGTGHEYLGARRLTPFVTLGAGMSFASPKLEGESTLPKAKSTAAFQMPLGLGVKYKLADRLNLTAEWVMHFTGTDKLDGIKDPYGINSSGLFKNTDSYSTLMVSLTYDIWARCKTCHNDRD